MDKRDIYLRNISDARTVRGLDLVRAFQQIEDTEIQELILRLVQRLADTNPGKGRD